MRHWANKFAVLDCEARLRGLAACRRRSALLCGGAVSNRSDGQGLVEFALIIPLLALILMGVFDLGRGIYAYNVVASAAREGARYGITNPTNTTGIQSQALANTVALDPSQLNVTSACSPDCNPSSSMKVTVTYTFQPVTLFFSNISMTGMSTMTIE